MSDAVELHAAAPLDDDTTADALARRLSLPRVRLASLTAAPEALERIAEKLARKHVALPLAVEGRQLILVMANPQDVAAQQDFEFASGLRIKPVVGARAEILDAIGQYYAPDDRIRDFVDQVADTPDFRILRSGSDVDEIDADVTETRAAAGRLVETAPVVKLCNLMVYDAVRAAASDIHVEPGVNGVIVRFRMDGVLRQHTRFPKWLHEPLVSRLKILARLDIAERRVPQDGRLKVVYHGRGLDLRVSTLPTHYGEKVVLRVLGGGRVPTLTELGLPPRDLESIESVIARAQGMVLVTGPTGSGKTTSLYSMLDRVRSGERNIVTIEDPIEYQLDGVNQVQVNTKAGLTFSTSLRSILRQDPDVILLGEIRDGETAEIAFQAAMTGHLVLSTLHTNSAVATIGRLTDLGVDAVVVSSSLSLVVAQRLVRRICEECREPYTPEVKVLGAFGLPVDRIYYRGRGCRACGTTGYAGRVGLYELLTMTREMRALIHDRAPELELRDAAVRQGMRLLAEAGADAVLAGLTTAEEIQRVVEPQTPIESSAPVGETRQPRILVVDDDAMMQRAVVAALRRLDDVTPIIECAANGSEALESVARHVPDLLVLDLMMPGVDGLEVCERLRSDLKTAFVPVLMLTGKDDEATRTRGFIVGTDDFMSKPFAVPELVARVRRLLRRSYGI